MGKDVESTWTRLGSSWVVPWGRGPWNGPCTGWLIDPLRREYEWYGLTNADIKAIYKCLSREIFPVSWKSFSVRIFHKSSKVLHKKMKNKIFCERESALNICHIQKALMPNSNHASQGRIPLPLISLFFLLITDHSSLPSSPAVMYKSDGGKRDKREM